jgi:hypothetical protein
MPHKVSVKVNGQTLEVTGPLIVVVTGVLNQQNEPGDVLHCTFTGATLCVDLLNDVGEEVGSHAQSYHDWAADIDERCNWLERHGG